ncbi:hypothetical protein ANRL4_05601 [Anaerolineae bacterium]|nr:hypothetical protein ANRL4_05601 [Anaerolineae bacterium]
MQDIITQVRPPDDGGAISLIGLKYQYHYAAGLCLDMLLHPDKIEYVASELQDDVVVKLNDGHYCFSQVKEKRTDLWTISMLESEGVWKRFLKLREEFGPGQVYLFVSDQDAQYSVNNRPDLGRFRKLTTEIGHESCNSQEIDDANQLIAMLVKKLGLTDDKEIAEIFWEIRIHTHSERLDGLIACNLIKLEEYLNQRGQASDITNRERIYRCMVARIEEAVAEPPAHGNLRERLEHRKVTALDLQDCIGPPFKSPTMQAFDLGLDPENRTLRKKSEDANLPEDLIIFFIGMRNYFSYRCRQDMINAADYVNHLRLKVWSTCFRARMPILADGTTYTPVVAYSQIWADLQAVADGEAQHNPPVQVDFEYLHGMMCQLTAECLNDWRPIG